MRTLHDVKFDALRNALYHKARQRRLDFWNRISNFFVLFLGTAAVAKGFGLFKVENTEIVIGALTALVGALKLVYDWSGRARTHEILQKKYYDVLAEATQVGEKDEKKIKIIDDKLIRIYGEEPPVLRALDSVAYNEARDALGSENGSNDNIILSWHQNLLKHVFAFHSTHFRSRKDLEISS